jgi:PAS domain S-box-containing protein
LALDSLADKLLFSQVQNLIKTLVSGKSLPPEVAVLKSILEETHEGIIIAGEEGRMLFMNTAARKIYGEHDLTRLSPETWSETFGLYKTDGSALIKPGDLPLARVLRGEEVENAGIFVRNERVPEGAVLNVRGRPLKDEKGALKGGLLFLTDVTLVKREQVRAQRMADLVDFSPIAIIETTPEARIISWNAGAQKVYGYQAHEIVGKPYSQLVPLDKLAEVQNQVAQLLRGETIMEHETVRQRKNGEIAVTWCSASPLYDEQHRVRGFALVTRDMTRRKLTPLVELVPEAILVTLPDGTITGWNMGATRIFGYSKEFMLGKNVMALFPPEKQMTARQLVERARFGEALFDYDTWGRQKSGETVRLSLSLLPSQDGAGHIANLTLVARDITELKLAEERISQLTALVDSSQEGVARDDLEGRILYWNKSAERIYGYSAGEVLGKPFSMLIPDGMADDFPKVVGYIREGRALQYEGLRRRKDGQLIHILATLVPLRDPAGEICGASIFISDITEQVRLREALRGHEEKLQRAQKMEAVGRLASGVAHDFNNWLMVLKGNLYNLEKETLGAEGRESVGHMQEVVKMAADLTRQLLLFSRGQATKSRSCDLNSILNESQPLLRPLLNPNLRLTLKLAESIPPILADSTEFHQVVMNLVVNAKDAMPKGGEILIKSGVVDEDLARRAGIALVEGAPWVYFTVQDEGEGMDEETRRHIFEPFFTTKAEGKGTGLGLALVYGIVNKQGGQILMESEKGKGAAFTLAFPACEPAGK